MRNKFIFTTAALAFASLAASANAAVITLQSVAASGGNYTFTYQGTLGPDEGVRAGDNLIIYDFTGYVSGSVFSSNPLISASTALTSPGLIVPGQTDNPLIPNLVFTYTGPNFHTTGGPFAPIDFNGLGAKSIYSKTHLDAFTTITTKNNPPPASNTTVVTLGEDLAPNSAVPEPESWAMMIGGFGLVGAFNRRRRAAPIVAA